MMAVQIPFYENPEEHARQQLQQKIILEIQKNVHQSLMELLTLKSLITQGQLCLFLPLEPQWNGFKSELGIQQLIYLLTNQMHRVPEVPPPTFQTPFDPKECRFSQGNNHEWAATKETKLLVCVNDDRGKPQQNETDDYICKPDLVEIKVDLRGILPAEISVNVDEKFVRIEAYHADKDGTKTYWRQYELPACVHSQLARCFLTYEGFLYIMVPWFKME